MPSHFPESDEASTEQSEAKQTADDTEAEVLMAGNGILIVITYPEVRGFHPELL